MWEMQAVCTKAVTTNNEKEKTVFKFNFLLTKNSQQRKTAQHYKTPMKSNIVSIGFYVWLFVTSLPENRDFLLMLYLRGLQTFLSDGHINYQTTVRPCCPPMSKPWASPWTAWPDGSGRWDNWMAAQHLPQDLVRPSSGFNNSLKRRRRCSEAVKKLDRTNQTMKVTDIRQACSPCFGYRCIETGTTVIA